MYSITEEEKKQMLDEISYYFREEHDLDVGMIRSEGIYDFFVEMLGDRVYNKALDDARRFYKKYAEDMDTDYYSLYRDVK